MKYDLIIKNGKIVSPESTIECDVAIVGEKIVALGKFDDTEAKRVIDVEGKYVMPGVVEAICTVKLHSKDVWELILSMNKV